MAQWPTASIRQDLESEPMLSSVAPPPRRGGTVRPRTAPTRYSRTLPGMSRWQSQRVFDQRRGDAQMGAMQTGLNIAGNRLANNIGQGIGEGVQYAMGSLRARLNDMAGPTVPWKLIGDSLGLSASEPEAPLSRQERIARAANPRLRSELAGIMHPSKKDPIIDDIKAMFPTVPAPTPEQFTQATRQQSGFGPGVPKTYEQLAAEAADIAGRMQDAVTPAATPGQFTQATRQQSGVGAGTVPQAPAAIRQQIVPQTSQAPPQFDPAAYLDAWRTMPATGNPTLSPETMAIEDRVNAAAARANELAQYRQELQAGGPVRPPAAVEDPNFNPYQGGAIGRRVAKIGPGTFRASPMQPATVGMGAPAPTQYRDMSVDQDRLAAARARNLYNPYGGLDERDSDLKNRIAQAQDAGVNFVGQTQEAATQEANAKRAQLAGYRQAREAAMVNRASPIREALGEAAEGQTDEDLVMRSRGLLPMAERQRLVQERAAGQAADRAARIQNRNAVPTIQQRMNMMLMNRNPGAFAEMQGAMARANAFGQNAALDRDLAQQRLFQEGEMGRAEMAMRERENMMGAAAALMQSPDPRSRRMGQNILEGALGQPQATQPSSSVGFDVNTMDWSNPTGAIDEMLKSGLSQDEVQARVQEAISMGLVAPDAVSQAATEMPMNPAGQPSGAGLLPSIPYVGPLLSGINPPSAIADALDTLGILPPGLWRETEADAAARKARQGIASRITGARRPRNWYGE